MEGAVAGFIEIQNDRRYRKLEFGDNNYWKSRLRATAYAFAFSTQFEVGPISEASLGNVQLKPPANGVVDRSRRRDRQVRGAQD